MKKIEERFANNLKRLRSQKCITQGQLAQVLGYSDKTVSKWERCGGIPSIETLYELSGFFAVSIDELFREEEIFLLGIDIGGTKTALVLSNYEGRVIKQIKTLGANPADLGIERAKEIIRASIKDICEGVNLSSIVAYVGSAGGLKYGFGDFFEEFGFRAFKVSGDIDNIIAAGLGEGDGIAMIMGTGINTYAKKNGSFRQAGGWGYFFDGGGSAFDIARDAFSHYFKVVDGIEKESLCSKYLGENVSNPKELLKDLYSGGKRIIASYSPCVFRAAEEGDEVANAIIDRNVDCAAVYAEAVSNIFDKYPIKLVIAGGLVNNKTIIDRMKLRLGNNGKYAVEKLEIEPVFGALNLAKKLAENTVPERK